MTKLVELDSKKHRLLKVKNNASLKAANIQHSINLRISEVDKAISSFPLFFTRVQETGQWAISAMTAFEADNNLFCTETEWQATYMPNAMSIYPLFLMLSSEDENKPAVGIFESSPAFSEEAGDALFDENGEPSLYQNRIKVLLDEDIKGGYQTYQFFQKIQSFELIKAIDLKVLNADKTFTRLKGLYTIDEEKLHALPKDSFEELRQAGYLPSIFAMLMSLFQLNNLINRHNAQQGVMKVIQVKMEEPGS